MQTSVITTSSGTDFLISLIALGITPSGEKFSEPSKSLVEGIPKSKTAEIPRA